MTLANDGRGQSGFAGRLMRWLHDEAGVEDPRRLVRSDGERTVISKFEPGFAQRLHELFDLLPEMFDSSAVSAAYAQHAAAAEAGAPRLEIWDRAMRSLLRQTCEQHGIDDDTQQAFIRAGLDSVRALLETVLWSVPTLADQGYRPRPGEIAAYREVTMRIGRRDPFTRYYGTFDGRPVENHCPGAAFARPMLAQAWTVCTGTPAPPNEA